MRWLTYQQKNRLIHSVIVKKSRTRVKIKTGNKQGLLFFLNSPEGSHHSTSMFSSHASLLNLTYVEFNVFNSTIELRIYRKSQPAILTSSKNKGTHFLIKSTDFIYRKKMQVDCFQTIWRTGKHASPQFNRNNEFTNSELNTDFSNQIPILTVETKAFIDLLECVPAIPPLPLTTYPYLPPTSSSKIPPNTHCRTYNSLHFSEINAMGRK